MTGKGGGASHRSPSNAKAPPPLRSPNSGKKDAACGGSRIAAYKERTRGGCSQLPVTKASAVPARKRPYEQGVAVRQHCRPVTRIVSCGTCVADPRPGLVSTRRQQPTRGYSRCVGTAMQACHCCLSESQIARAWASSSVGTCKR